MNCKKAVTTSQLVNDENLRQRVEKYLKGELDNCQDGGGVGDVQAEHDKSVSSSSKSIEMVINSDEDHLPPVKKFKNNNNFNNGVGVGHGGCYNCNNQVTLSQMRERNAEFDRKEFISWYKKLNCFYFLFKSLMIFIYMYVVK